MRLSQAYLSATLYTGATGREVDEDRMTRQMQPGIALMTAVEGHLLDVYGACLDTLGARGIRPITRE